MNRRYMFFIISGLLIIIIILFLILYPKTSKSKRPPRPNIVVIIADDMGWNDVSYHGSDQIMTPNIDLLAYSGVALERYYTHCACTPSRSAFLTGKFSHVIGMQGFPLTSGEDRSIPLKEKLLPQYLKELGYATHLVGKWHVGHARTAYLPTSRGYDTHFGHRMAYIDYYEYFFERTSANSDVSGLDLYRNLNVDWTSNKYVTDLYNEEAIAIIEKHDSKVPLFLTVAHNAPHCGNAGAPLQAPAESVRAMRHISSSHRRTYAAMVNKLDDSVGDIMKALMNKGMLEDTIIVFVSDNGGMTSGQFMNYASNWPLRGLKMTAFEGGIRVNGVLWSYNLTRVKNHVWDGYIHAVDWVPTLLRAAGADTPLDIDGINLWESIKSGHESKRDFIIEVDDITGFASITFGDFKLISGKIPQDIGDHQGAHLQGIIGKSPSYSDTLKKSTLNAVLKNIGINSPLNYEHIRNKMRVNCFNVTETTEDLCFPDQIKGKLCLFNIKEDPCEYRDVSKLYPHLVEDLNIRLQTEIRRAIPRNPGQIYIDPRSDPSLHNFTWTTWADKTM